MQRQVDTADTKTQREKEGPRLSVCLREHYALSQRLYSLSEDGRPSAGTVEPRGCRLFRSFTRPRSLPWHKRRRQGYWGIPGWICILLCSSHFPCSACVFPPGKTTVVLSLHQALQIQIQIQTRISVSPGSCFESITALILVLVVRNEGRRPLCFPSPPVPCLAVLWSCLRAETWTRTCLIWNWHGIPLRALSISHAKPGILRPAAAATSRTSWLLG